MFHAEINNHRTGEPHSFQEETGTLSEFVNHVFHWCEGTGNHVVTRILQGGKIIPLPVTADDQQRVLHGVDGATEKAKADLERFYERCAA